MLRKQYTFVDVETDNVLSVLDEETFEQTDINKGDIVIISDSEYEVITDVQKIINLDTNKIIFRYLVKIKYNIDSN